MPSPLGVTLVLTEAFPGLQLLEPLRRGVLPEDGTPEDCIT